MSSHQSDLAIGYEPAFISSGVNLTPADRRAARARFERRRASSSRANTKALSRAAA